MLKSKPLKNILFDYLNNQKNNQYDNSIKLIKLEKIWKEVVGPNIHLNTEIILYKNGKLIIKVTTPVWRNEISLQKSKIIQEINKNNNNIKITEIILK